VDDQAGEAVVEPHAAVHVNGVADESGRLDVGGVAPELLLESGAGVDPHRRRPAQLHSQLGRGSGLGVAHDLPELPLVRLPVGGRGQLRVPGDHDLGSAAHTSGDEAGEPDRDEEEPSRQKVRSHPVDDTSASGSG
jgi:hypothetical protein